MNHSEADHEPALKEPWHCTGWIPVVSGNMSFTEIGKTAYAQGFELKHIASSDRRNHEIVAWGRKSFNDGWLPARVRRWVEKKETRFYALVALKAHPENQLRRESLEGVVILSPEAGQVKEWYELAENQGVSSVLIQIQNSPSDKVGLYVMQSKINRNGRCDIKLPGHLDERQASDLGGAAFILLKNLSHYHYHHGTADSITYAHLHNGDDSEWMSETLFSLHRAIVSARRFASQKRLRDALGISAYAQAFDEKVLKSNSEPNSGPINSYSYEPLRLSIQSLLEGVKIRTERRISNVVVMSTIMLAFVALFITASQLDQLSEVDWPNWVILSAGFAIERPGLIISLIFAFYIAGLTFAGNENFFNRRAIATAENLYGRLAFLPRWLIIMLYILIGALGVWAGYELIKYALTLDVSNAGTNSGK